MNSIVLNAQIINDPQLRYTGGENQERVADTRIQFSGIGKDSPPSQVKLTAWNTAADQLIKCSNGSTVQIVGRLSPYAVEHNGVNERYMEIVASQIAQISIFNEGSSDAEDEIEPQDTANVADAAPQSAAAKSRPGKQTTTARRRSA